MPGSVGEFDEKEQRIHDSWDQHGDQCGYEEVEPVLVTEDEDNRSYDQQ